MRFLQFVNCAVIGILGTPLFANATPTGHEYHGKIKSVDGDKEIVNVILYTRDSQTTASFDPVTGEPKVVHTSGPYRFTGKTKEFKITSTTEISKDITKEGLKNAHFKEGANIGISTKSHIKADPNVTHQILVSPDGKSSRTRFQLKSADPGKGTIMVIMGDKHREFKMAPDAKLLLVINDGLKNVNFQEGAVVVVKTHIGGGGPPPPPDLRISPPPQLPHWESVYEITIIDGTEVAFFEEAEERSHALPAVTTSPRATSAFTWISWVVVTLMVLFAIWLGVFWRYLKKNDPGSAN